MRLGRLGVTLLAVSVSPPAVRHAAAQVTTEARDVRIDDGTLLRVEAGELQVPESRRRPTARRVTIPFYRLRSESSTPAAPIFLLAGGPGSSWLDLLRRDENFREVAFYRTVADVVLFDQRGAGHARPAMTCPETATVPAGVLLDPAAFFATLRDAVIACRDHWQHAGVDLAAYNTVENAADVNDLRLALGYQRITLIGGSYGSHLALQYMRQHPESVDRVVMYGVEGPDHTWDNPSGILGTLGRLAAEAERAPELAPFIPPGGLLRALERVASRLDSAPQTVVATRGTDSVRVVVTGNHVRGMARQGAGNRGAPNAWPEAIMALDRGDLSMVARGAIAARTIRPANPMHYSMDCSSGISAARRQRYRDDPATAVLGNINLEYEVLCDVWPTEELGESFRANVVSDHPTVIFHGTLDMSTPIENAREVVASLRNGQLVEVVGGNHGALYNLYERWPPMYALLRAFLSGDNIRFPSTVVDTREVRFRPPARSPQPD